MSTQKLGFEETLGRHILPDKCIGCCACIIVCPFKSLEYVERRPALVRECRSCGICVKVCPKFETSTADLERFIFGRERGGGEDFGVHNRIVIARSRDERILRRCQDGGAVTSILTFALKNGIVEGAIVSGIDREEPLKPTPKIIDDADELLECAGTRYTYSPNLLALKKAVIEGRGNLAFVGTPCQITAIRKMGKAGLKRYSEKVNLLIGLFCSECFTYKGLIKEYIIGELGIDPYRIEKMNIKGKLIIKLKDGSVTSSSLKELRRYRDNCGSCPDYSAELSDISAGGVGLDGWTLLISRSIRGEEILKAAEKEGFLKVIRAEENMKPINLLRRLSRRKRERNT